MIEFKLDGKEKVIILQNGKDVGHIFTPSSSSNDSLNAIQVCGFSEAFTLWGCGIYKGFKDIQLLYDGEKMKGRFDPSNCWSCFHDPCQCETEKDEESGMTKGTPFTIKSWRGLGTRLRYRKSSPHYVPEEIIQNKLKAIELEKDLKKLATLRLELYNFPMKTHSKFTKDATEHLLEKVNHDIFAIISKLNTLRDSLIKMEKDERLRKEVNKK